jgi:exopolysaccharide biosynthesis protein
MTANGFCVACIAGWVISAGMFPALKMLPFAVITLLLASCGRGPAAGSGVSYQHEKVSSEPWSIHIAKMDRTRADLQIRTTLARDTVLGLSTLAQQVKALPSEAGQPLAAINGDFYVVDGKDPYIGDPRGLQIMDGELLSAPSDQATFWINSTGQPQATNITSQLSVTWPDGSSTPMGLNERCASGAAVLYTPRHGQSTRTKGVRELILEPAGDEPWLPLQAGRTINARVREVRNGGDTALASGTMVLAISESALTGNASANQIAAGATITLSTATIPDLSGVKMAISGGYVLLRDGKKQDIQTPQSDAYKYRSVGERHPRAAIGANRDHIFLVVVDGRQPELSMGMTLAELGAYMQKLGCELALSLDGGASATFWYDGKVLNSPCNGGDRPIANGIVVLAKPDAKR